MPIKPRSVTLVWHARTPEGWRYFPVLFERMHGQQQPRHGWVMHHGIEVEYPHGRYMLHSRIDGRKVYTEVKSCHPRDAMVALQSAKLKASKGGAARNPLRYIESAAQAYAKTLEDRRKPEMAEKGRHVLKEFQELVTRKAGIVHMVSITGKHVIAFHNELLKKGNSERTVYEKHMQLGAWLRFCKVEIEDMPKAPTFELKTPTIYQLNDTAAIRSAAFEAGDTYMLLMIDMALKMGLREQELMYSEWDDIDWERRKFRVQGKVRAGWRFAVKDKEQRNVPIPDDLLQSLMAWRKTRSGTVLILGNDHDQPEGHLLRKLKALARKAALNCGKCEGCQRDSNKGPKECDQWTLHKFRRTYLTTLLRNQVDPRTVQSLAGHSDFESTMRYLRPLEAEEMQGPVSAIKWH